MKENNNKSKIDYRLLVALIVYAVIIGIAWGVSRNSISTNEGDIGINKVNIKELKDESVKSRLQIKELSIQVEYMIDLQEEMHETLKELDK